MSTRQLDLIPHTPLALVVGWTAVAVHAFTLTTIIVITITGGF